MAAVVNVKIKTERRYETRLPSIIKTIESDAHQVGYNFARNVAKGYRERVHVWPYTPPGEHIKDHILVERIEAGKFMVIADRDYAVYEEYGTRYRPPHPAFRPAVEHSLIEFRREFGALFHGVHR